MWTPREAREEAVVTARAAADLLDEHSDACFAMSQAAVYRWIAEDDPGLLQRILGHIESGRWEPVGGWWVEADLFGASPLSIRKQAEIGQAAFVRLTGRRCTVGFSPDAFGHPAWLPDLLVEAGLDTYVITRPGDHEAGLPAAFLWEGPRGGRVRVLRPQGYGGAPKPDASGLSLYGVGNHGGGPTKEHLEEARRLCSEGAARHGLVCAAGPADDLPVVTGDLVHHARGCYSALTSFKERMRRTELRLAQLGAPPEHWQTFLFWQFHDVLAGTSVPEVYEEAEADLLWLERALAPPVPRPTQAPTFVPRHRVDEGRPVRVRETAGDRWDGWISVTWTSSVCASDVSVDGARAVLRRVEQHGTAWRLHVLLWVVLRPGEEEILTWRPVPGPAPTPPPPPEGVRLAVLDDGTDTWGHTLRAFGPEVEPGPATELHLAGGPDGMIEAWGQWHERDRALKLIIPSKLPPTDGEMPGGEWDGPRVWGRVWSYDVVAGELRITLLRSPPYALHDPTRREPGVIHNYQEQGPFLSRLWLEPEPLRVPPVVETL